FGGTRRGGRSRRRGRWWHRGLLREVVEGREGLRAALIGRGAAGGPGDGGEQGGGEGSTLHDGTPVVDAGMNARALRMGLLSRLRHPATHLLPPPRAGEGWGGGERSDDRTDCRESRQPRLLPPAVAPAPHGRRASRMPAPSHPTRTDNPPMPVDTRPPAI